MENVFLFPTLISRDKRKVSIDEKNVWFDLYLEHSTADGRSHDFLGFEDIHHEPTVEFFYKDILMPAVQEYLTALKVDTSNMDIFVTKSFFNVTRKSGIRQHDHAENHISFVYYPHVPKELERSLMLWDPRRKHPNEPYKQFFADNVTEWDAINARVMYMPVEEGVLYIFPSDMEHDIEVKGGDIPSGLQCFVNRHDLHRSRFCVAGDMMVIRNHTRSYQRMLPPVEKWKKF